MQDLTSQLTPQMTAAGIPRSLAPCFQEYDIEKLDPAQHGDLIIERVLAYGDRRELRWLFDLYGWARVTDWVQRLEGADCPGAVNPSILKMRRRLLQETYPVWPIQAPALNRLVATSLLPLITSLLSSLGPNIRDAVVALFGGGPP